MLVFDVLQQNLQKCLILDTSLFLLLRIQKTVLCVLLSDSVHDEIVLLGQVVTSKCNALVMRCLEFTKCCLPGTHLLFAVLLKFIGVLFANG